VHLVGFIISKYIFIPMIFWDERPCTSLDSYDNIVAAFKGKLKSTVCVMWMRESARDCDRNSGNEWPLNRRFANGKI
jgi:hypothetical protein